MLLMPHWEYINPPMNVPAMPPNPKYIPLKSACPLAEKPIGDMRLAINTPADQKVEKVKPCINWMIAALKGDVVIVYKDNLTANARKENWINRFAENFFMSMGVRKNIGIAPRLPLRIARLISCVFAPKSLRNNTK